MRDIDLRQKLRTDERLHHGEPDTRIVEELGLCQGIARVDLAVVNGTIHGYEIKSERDTLDRLPGQIAVYGRVLDFVTLVTAPPHADKVRRVIPRWWGLWTGTEHPNGEIHLREVRRPCRNPNVSAFDLVQLLWRDEALQALLERNLAGGMLSKSRRDMWGRLASELTLQELGHIVRECIKSRGPSWRAV